jgi:hypothetical protein
MDDLKRARLYTRSAQTLLVLCASDCKMDQHFTALSTLIQALRKIREAEAALIDYEMLHAKSKG